MTTAADELRAAATRLRERAQRAGQGLGAAIREGACDLFGNARPDPAAMDPHVGALLADWLDATATSLATSTHPDWQETVAQHPLAIARAINGGRP